MSVSGRIREAYQDSFGDWCYEKGKSKEIRFLKEACEQLDWSRRQSDIYYRELQVLREEVDTLTTTKELLNKKIKEYEDNQ